MSPPSHETQARLALRARDPIVWIALLSSMMVGCASIHEGDSREEASAIADAAGAGMASAVATAVYAPVKIVYAASGAIVGGGAYVVSGGDAELAGEVMGPAVTGHYIVTPERLRTPGALQVRGRGFETSATVDPVEAPEPLPDVAAAVFPCGDLGEPPRIYFESGVTALDDEARTLLAETATTLLECPDRRAEIRAYSDALGSREANFALSARRAQIVRDFFVHRGVDEDRLQVVNFGEDHPVAANATKEGRAANRRVEVVVE